MAPPRRSVVVTGSSSGIGAAIAARLAGPGVGLVVHARRNREGAEATAARAREAGAETIVQIGDLAEPATGAALIEAAVSTFGGLDILVANAGLFVPKVLGEGTRDELDYALAANLGGFFEMVTAALPHLERAENARVVAISTHNAHIYRADYTNFSLSAASKAGLEAMTRGLALQLATKGVTVNCVVPGLIRRDWQERDGLSAQRMQEWADKIPVGRLGTPDEVAAVVAFVVSADASYLTGQLIHVNGGFI
jgi:NAD(P)-dependent dehydrogenase (short-subunit alcohol dehydrogenase family)